PIVFTSVVQAELRASPPPDVTGVWLAFDWAGTLEAALRLQPDIRRVLVVGGAAPADRLVTDTARAQLERFRGSVEMTFVNDQTLSQVTTLVRTLPDDTIVLVCGFIRDAADILRGADEARRRIATASRRPVYAVVDVPFGSGVVGGSLVDFAAQGEMNA